MSKINHYKNLLLEEERLTVEIALSKFAIEENIKSYLNPKNLFDFFEDKLEENIKEELSGELDLKKYLISLSLDFLYDKIATSILKSSDTQKSGIDWKLIVKPFVDKFYISNKHYVTDLVSIYIDKGIKKWTDR